MFIKTSDLACRALITNNLPIALKPITYISDPHQTPVTLKHILR